MYMETSTHKIFRFSNNCRDYEVRLDKEGYLTEILKGNSTGLTQVNRGKLEVICLMKKKNQKLYLKFRRALNEKDSLYKKLQETD